MIIKKEEEIMMRKMERKEVISNGIRIRKESILILMIQIILIIRVIILRDRLCLMMTCFD